MSTVQFNLLPDVKLEFQRSQHAKRLVYGVSTLVTLIAVAIFVFSFFVVDVLQKKLLSDANADITHYSSQLKAIPNLEKILTIQNQLGALPNLHSQKHYASRLFTYLPQITPAKVNIGKISLDTTANTLEIDGTADLVETINKFVDTLKFTYYTDGSNTSTKNKAFSNVILTKVDRNDKEASYTINTSFDPRLFSGAQGVTLVVPSEITTRSVINTPLFNGDTGKPDTKNSTNTTQQGTQ